MLWHRVLSLPHTEPFPNNPNPSEHGHLALAAFSCLGNFTCPSLSRPPPGQILYRRVLWPPEQNLNAAYKLQLEKVYLCTGRAGHVPLFDPTGTVYNQGPQYGCIQPHKYLKHRFLLLVSALLLLLPVWDLLWQPAGGGCKGMRKGARGGCFVLLLLLLPAVNTRSVFPHPLSVFLNRCPRVRVEMGHSD